MLLSDFGYLILALFLVLLNGFFVAAEFAMVKVRATRIREMAEQGGWRAGVAKAVIDHLDAYLSATQLGITLASLGLGWLGEPAFAHLLEMVLGPILPAAALHGAAFIAAFAIISFLHIVLGELAPKSLAISRPEATSLWVAAPLRVFYYLMYPAIWALNNAALACLKLFGVQPVGEGETAHSEEELRMIVAASHAQGVLNASERTMLENVMEFSERRVTQIMVPRPDMVCLDVASSMQENLDIVRENQHTRYPVASGNKDTIIGMIHVKDLLTLGGATGVKTLAELRRPILFVPESAMIDHLLKTFQRRRSHMAIVVDEYGGVSGMVTLEDVLEEIVGEIRDEFDAQEEATIEPMGDKVMVDAGLPLEEAAERFGFTYPPDDAINTVGGYVLKLLGRVPKEGETVTMGRHRVEVMEMDGLRVAQLRFHLLPGQEMPKSDPVDDRQ